MPKYLKLGPKANTFYDASTDLSISNKQVVRVKTDAGAKPMIANALATRHIEWATEEEYNAYNKTREGLETDALAKHQENLRSKGLMAGTLQAPGPRSPLNAPKAKDDDDEDDDEDEEPITKGELIDYLKDSPFVNDDQKKVLTKLTKEELTAIYNTVKSK